MTKTKILNCSGVNLSSPKMVIMNKEDRENDNVKIVSIMVDEDLPTVTVGI